MSYDCPDKLLNVLSKITQCIEYFARIDVMV